MRSAPTGDARYDARRAGPREFPTPPPGLRLHGVSGSLRATPVISSERDAGVEERPLAGRLGRRRDAALDDGLSGGVSQYRSS